MNLDRYEYTVNESLLDFEFCSDGPNGKIKKTVSFNPYNSNGVTYFNIAFGDWNENSNQIDDQSVSNNEDTTKVLATVAAAILDFTGYFPDLAVYAKGSTPART